MNSARAYRRPDCNRGSRWPSPNHDGGPPGSCRGPSGSKNERSGGRRGKGKGGSVTCPTRTKALPFFLCPRPPGSGRAHRNGELGDVRVHELVLALPAAAQCRQCFYACRLAQARSTRRRPSPCACRPGAGPALDKKEGGGREKGNADLEFWVSLVSLVLQNGDEALGRLLPQQLGPRRKDAP